MFENLSREEQWVLAHYWANHYARMQMPSNSSGSWEVKLEAVSAAELHKLVPLFGKPAIDQLVDHYQQTITTGDIVLHITPCPDKQDWILCGYCDRGVPYHVADAGRMCSACDGQGIVPLDSPEADRAPRPDTWDYIADLDDYYREFPANPWEHTPNPTEY